jgi:hypothetical protein
MSPMALWLCMILFIGSAVAVDVPFVFNETSSSVAGYNSNQLEQAYAASSDLAGVPMVTLVNDDEVIAFPVTGGGSAPGGKNEKSVGELKEIFDARVEPGNEQVNREAIILAGRHSGDLIIDQIASIYSYLKSNNDLNKGWSYVRDTRGIDNFRYANDTLEIGKLLGCAGAGDCDDFAILMSALIESIGGTTRIILVSNSTSGGHAYTEVYLGNLNEQNNQVESIIKWLEQEFDTDKIFTHIDTDTKDIWLNLDWGADEEGNTHPGGPFYRGDKHIVLCIRDEYEKTPLKMAESYQESPISSSPVLPKIETNIDETDLAVQEKDDGIIGMSKVVINEIELSPPYNESVWVELYSNGDATVDLTGWKIAIVEGNQQEMIQLFGSIEPKRFLTIYGRPDLDAMGNGNVILYDASGAEVDKTPLMNDNSHSDFTYGRMPDGKKTGTAGDFAFMMASKGRSNVAKWMIT